MQMKLKIEMKLGYVNNNIYIVSSKIQMKEKKNITLIIININIILINRMRKIIQNRCKLIKRKIMSNLIKYMSKGKT